MWYLYEEETNKLTGRYETNLEAHQAMQDNIRYELIYMTKTYGK